ncbi:MAG: hypothetical protein EBR82_16900 [Caulobacteraceae bacterium]|nr:hypothetical protein [Caulobacteraceae bacterium]
MAELIELAWYEVHMATSVANLRQIMALRDGRQDAHGFAGDPWRVHMEGACGEMALAKFLGVYWSGSVDAFRLPDVGSLQVRTRSSHEYDLIVRHADSDESRYVLITGQAPRYVIHGWMLGKDAKQSHYYKTYGDRPGAFFVPQSDLRDITLIGT